MNRAIPSVGHAAVRVDVHMPHYEGFAEPDDERLGRLAELIRKAVFVAILQHAEAEIGYVTSLHHSIHTRIHDGLGPAWSPVGGSEPFVPGSFSAADWEKDYSLEPLEFYQMGAKHVTVFAGWS